MNRSLAEKMKDGRLVCGMWTTRFPPFSFVSLVLVCSFHLSLVWSWSVESPVFYSLINHCEGQRGPLIQPLLSALTAKRDTTQHTLPDSEVCPILSAVLRRVFTIAR